jgi:pimeloyl-ACP methyl ester carboxylesterase/NAD(P)-dependent dehydrogenase (short-subunit alcohol dehydrogenase family)/acyl carrier protein
MTAASRGDMQPLRGILALAALAAPTSEELPAGLLNSLRLLQARQDTDAGAPIWFVTQGAVPALGDQDLSAPLQAPIWGLGRTALLESGNIVGGLVDLPTVFGDEDGEQLCLALLSGAEQVAVRPRERRVPRLARLPQSRATSEWKGRDTALLTGGSGALARHAARWLAERGVSHVVLASRRGDAAPGSEALSAELAAKGVRVSHVRCDISDRGQVAQLIARIDREGPPLRTVVHAAGALDDRLLANLTPDALACTWAPKLAAAWHLHELTRHHSLDAFVLFSSISSVLGNPGQGNYASANAGLDALAAHRRALGLPALSIAWGPWADGGMVDEKLAEASHRSGVSPLPPDKALSALGAALVSGKTSVCVADFDWPRLCEAMTESRALSIIAEIPDVARELEKLAQKRISQDDLQALARMPLAQRTEHVRGSLDGLIKRLMQTSELDPDTSLLELGFDSLMAMELVSKIRQLLRVTVYPREVLAHPTLNQLSAYVAQQLAEPEAGADTAAHSEGLLLEQLPTRTYRPVQAAERVAGMTFVLSAPRSGSTLLRTMLAGHSALFSPPELHLLPFESMAGRESDLSGSYLSEGLTRAFMELLGVAAPEAIQHVQGLVASDVRILDVYRELRELAGERQLVDKSPMYAFNEQVLARAEELFDRPKYVHIVRHPYAMVESFLRMRMHKMFGTEGIDALSAAELIWSRTNQNASLLGERLGGEGRYLLVKYEDLVIAPEQTSRDLCAFLEIEFEEAMLNPYRGSRMTDGIHAVSLPIGDQNFLKHKSIDASLANTWQTVRLPRPLGAAAVSLSNKYGYELPEQAATSALVSSTEVRRSEVRVKLREHTLCVSHWGSDADPAVLCLHGAGDQGPIWEPLAKQLVGNGLRVIAPDLRGHGLSDHSGGQGASFSELVADIQELCAALSLTKVCLVGHSFGTLLASAFASSTPELVNALCLVEPIVPASVSLGQRLSRYLELRRTPTKHRPFASESEALRRFADIHPSMEPALREALAKRLLTESSDGFVWRSDPSPFSIGDSVERQEYLALLEELSLPVCVLFASEGERVRPEDATALRTALSGALWRDAILQGSHAIHHERPHDLARHIVALSAEAAVRSIDALQIKVGFEASAAQ